MTNLVEVVPYQTEWPHLFALESALVKKTLGENCITVYHVGSTSIPGLNAKPLIDMIPVVKNIMQVDQTTSAMQALGYEALGESGIPFRRFFKKNHLNKAYNVHVYEENNSEIERHLKFGAWLRAHPADRDAYGKLKHELALKFPNDLMSYWLGKDEFIGNIDKKAGFDGLRIVRALTEREWHAARHFRQTYFFDKISIADPYTWTFEHDQHVHFILYKSNEIIGYAHIQLWPEHRAALRIIVIDEPYRNAGSGSQFLKMCERWLVQQNIKTLHLESSPEAHPFYCKHGYIRMPFNDPDHNTSHPADIPVGKIL